MVKILQIIPAPDHMYDKFFYGSNDTEFHYKKVMCLALTEEPAYRGDKAYNFVETMTQDANDGSFNLSGEDAAYICSEVFPEENRCWFSAPIEQTDTDERSDQS